MIFLILKYKGSQINIYELTNESQNQKRRGYGPGTSGLPKDERPLKQWQKEASRLPQKTFWKEH